MSTVLLVIHLFVTLALIGVVLVQRSEGGGLGIGTAQGMGSFMTGRGTANLLTRTTAILAAIFFGLSLTLALLNRGTAGAGRHIVDVPVSATLPALPSAPAPPAGPVATTRAAPAAGAGPAGAPATSPPIASAPAAPLAKPAPVVPLN